MSQFDILSQSSLIQPINIRERRHTLHFKTKNSKTELEDY